MTHEEMNVHQALTELKTLESRIEKGITSQEWVAVAKASSETVRGVARKEWIDRAKDNYRSVIDLIRRRDAIKRAVVNSNAVTKVVIAGKEYTVAEAIDKKNHSIEFLERFRRRIQHDYTVCRDAVVAENGDRLELRADQYIRSLIGNTDTKGMSAEIEKMRKEFIDKQKFELVDPIKALDVIKILDNEMESFMRDVDSILSTSNALTKIVVDY